MNPTIHPEPRGVQVRIDDPDVYVVSTGRSAAMLLEINGRTFLLEAVTDEDRRRLRAMLEAE